MKRDAQVLLITGLLVGFLATHLLVRDRDLGPMIVRQAVSVPGTASGASVEDELNMIRELERELIERPEDFQLLVDLANLYFDIQSFQGAVAYYERALGMRPEDPDLRTDMATALYYSNQIDRAIAEFERSLTVAPNHPQTLFNMGVALLEQRNDPAGAIELWEQLVRANPDYPQRAMVQSEIDRLKGQP
jgi:cytochrome c-type biogenesis protein CcmH/NrfG